MSATSVWIIALCLWGLTHYWWLPLTKQRWQAEDLRAKIARAGTMATLEKIRDLSAIGLITLSLVILFVAACGGLAHVSFAVPKIVLGALSRCYAFAKEMSEHYGSALELFGLVGAIVVLAVVSRQAKTAVSRAWIEKANELYAKIRANPKEELEALAKNPELKPATDRLAQVAHFISLEGQPGGPTDKDVAAARQEVDRILQHLAIEGSRTSVHLDEAVKDAQDPQATGRLSGRQRFARILFSGRLMKDLGLVGKPISYAATALLFLTLLGWSAAPLASTLQLAVNNLRINSVKADAVRDLNAALSESKKDAPDAPSQSPSVSAEEIRVVTQLIARATARELVRSSALVAELDTRRSPLAEGEYVRARLAGHDLDTAGHGAIVDHIRFEVNQQVLHDPDRLDAIPPLQERLERDVHDQVEALAKNNRSVFERVRATLEARYSAPAAPLESEGRLIESIVSNALEGVEADTSSELGKEAQKLLKEFGKNAVQTWADSTAERLVTNLIIGAVHGEVMAAPGAQFSFQSSTEAREFFTNLRNAGGTGWTASAQAHQDVEVDRKVANAIATAVADDPASRAALQTRLGGYEGLFPLGTPDGSPPPTNDLGGGGSSNGGGGGGGGGGAGGERSRGPAGVGENIAGAERAAVRAEASGLAQAAGRAASFGESRAASFLLSARSFRVRGVLVGRDLAADGITLDDLRWVVMPAGAGGTTRVHLDVRRNGEWLQLGEFDAGVVNQAIRYAADRRVVATTITPGDRKITSRLTYLHPVLANTPLGCRIVEVDRLVDTFSVESAARAREPAMATLAADRNAMWQWMNLMSLSELVANIPATGCQEDELRNALAKRQVESTHFSAPLADALSHFLDAREKQSPGSTRVIRAAQACGKGPQNQLAHCMCSQVAGTANSTAYWMPEDHTSQFREREVTLRPDMKWMMRSADHLSNIDLWVHTTFALHQPSSQGADPQVDEASAIALDFPSSELEALRSVVLAGLPQYVATKIHSPSYDQFLAPVEDFVLIQRLMRAALDGRLGPNFPVEKLLKLESDTRAFVPTQPTIKWEPGSEGEKGLLQTLAAADSRAVQSYSAWRMDSVDRQHSKAVCDSASL